MTRAELDRAAAPLIENDVNALAPSLIDPVNQFLVACADEGVPFVINETVRSNALQVLYYSYGRDTEGHVIGETITNAPDASRSWHGYHLALDGKHPDKGYNVPLSYWSRVAAIAARYGLAWGGKWAHQDLPHFQAAALPASPTIQDRDDFAHNRLGDVWKRYGLAA